ncbi:MAG: translocation/assembly module TamB domain-containing protein [Candidatus Sericytochromatia bacterium]
MTEPEKQPPEPSENGSDATPEGALPPLPPAGESPSEGSTPPPEPSLTEDPGPQDATSASDAADSAEAAPPARRKGLLSYGLQGLGWGFRYGLMSFCLVLLALIAILWRPPAYLLDFVARQIEGIVKSQVGLPLQIGRIKTLELRLGHQLIEIDNLLLWGYEGAGRPFAVIPHARLESDLLSWLLGRDQVALLSIDSPQIHVIRDPQGRINLRPELKPSEGPAGEPMALPRIKLALNDLIVTLRNEDENYRLDDRYALPFVRGDVYDGYHALLNGSVRNGLAKFWANSQVHIYEGEGWAAAQASSANLQRLNPYTRMVRELNFLGGGLEGGVWANWDDWSMKGLRYTGHVELDDMLAYVPYYRDKVMLDGAARFDEKNIDLRFLNLRTGLSVLNAQGRIQNYVGKLGFDLKLQSPGLHLGPLIKAVAHPAVKEVRALNPQGILTADLRLQGPPERLGVSGVAGLPTFSMQDLALRDARARFNYSMVNNATRAEVTLANASWQDLRLNSARTTLNYAKDQLAGQLWLGGGAWQRVDFSDVSAGYSYNPRVAQVSNLRGQAFSGEVRAGATVGLAGRQTLLASLEANGIQVGEVQRELGIQVPADFRPNGAMRLTAQASGPLSDPVASGVLSSPRISFPVSTKLTSLSDLRGDFSYSRPLSQFSLRTNSADAGLLQAQASLRNLDQLQASLNARYLPLATANRFSPEAYLAGGTAALDARMQGSLRAMQRNWMNFGGLLSFKARELDLRIPQDNETVAQHLDVAELQVDWQRGNAHVQRLVLAEDDSRLNGTLRLSLPSLMEGTSLEKALLGRIDGEVDLEDFPILKEYDVQKGRVQLALDARSVATGELEASLSSEGRELLVQGIHLDRYLLATAFAENKLKIDQARLIHQGDEASVTGSVDLNTASPSLDLQANAEDFKLETLVALLPPGLRRQIEPDTQASGPPPADSLPNSYGLPDINQRNIFRVDRQTPLAGLRDEDLSISWREVYQHWDRWKLTPNTEPYVPPTEKAKTLLETLRGRLSLNAKIAGTVENPDLDVQSLLQDLHVQNSDVAETYLNARFKDQVVTIDEMYVMEQQGGLLQARGTVDLNNDMNLELSGRGVRLQMAKPFLPQSMRLEGALDFLATAGGSLSNPRVSARMDINRLLFNQIFFDQLSSLTGYEEGYLRDSRVELNYGDQQVVAYGDVPVPDLNKPMDVTLQLQDDSFGLINLFTTALDWRKGQGALLVKVVNTPRNPQLEGSVQLDGVEIYVPALKESVTDLRVRGELTRQPDEFGVIQQNVKLDTVKGNFGGGTVSAEGSLDLLNLLPSYFNLRTQLDKVTIDYSLPGLLDTHTPLETATLQIQGLVNQPIITGKIFVGSGGNTHFPFLRDQQDIPATNSVSSEGSAPAKPAFLFGGLKVYLTDDYQLTSPIFDIPITSQNGLDLRHYSGQMTLLGDISADEGTLYLLNNVLTVDQLKVNFERPRNPNETALNPRFDVLTSFNVEGATQPVKARITGALSDVSSNTLDFEFSDTQGLSDTQILAQLVGFQAVEGLSQGDLTGVATQFSDAVLRGLFDPLTSRISSLLGLEELSFGIAGQSINGPVFKFALRSNPFFFMDELVEEQLSQLEFLDRLRLRGTGLISDQVTYQLGANYRISPVWSLDYNFEQVGSVHKVQVTGNYLLDQVLRWMDYTRRQWFGWDGPAPEATPAEPTEQTSADESSLAPTWSEE